MNELEMAAELAVGLGAGQSYFRPRGRVNGPPPPTPLRPGPPSTITSGPSPQGPMPARGYDPHAFSPYGVLSAHQSLVNLQRLQASNAMDAGGHIYGRPAPPPPNYARPPSGSKKQHGGLGIPGPWAGKDILLKAGPYEITGTQVALFDVNATLPPRGTSVTPSTSGVIGFFNNDAGDNGGRIAGTPNQVDANGEVSNIGGRKWAKVSVATGSGQTTYGTNVSPGQVGWVPVDYMADIGWTASNGGVTGIVPVTPKPVQPGLPATPPEQKPPLLMTGAAPKNWTPWLIASFLLVGIGGFAYLAYSEKKKKRKKKHAKGKHGRR